jgi:hypothetical protein
MSSKPRVGGSNPSGRANYFKGLRRDGRIAATSKPDIDRTRGWAIRAYSLATRMHLVTEPKMRVDRSDDSQDLHYLCLRFG